MSARSIFSVIVLGLAACPVVSFAQTDVLPPVENANYIFSALTNATAMVRSGPAESYYATMKLGRDSPLTVVGIKYDWLKIVPPEGSFSYVAKQYVEKQADGTGRVTGDDVNVRAGSKLSSLKATVQCKVNRGDVVSIIGEADEYYQIKPPPGAFLFVHKTLANPVKVIGKATTQPATGGVAYERQPAPTTQPALTVEPHNEAEIARTQALQAKAETEFERLETEFKALDGTAIDQQPVPELLAGYEKLSRDENLPTSMLRVVERRLPVLRTKNEIREQVLAMMRKQEELKKKTDEATLIRQKQEEKMKATLEVYTALGTLQPSSFQPGGGTIYRITDPATGRTQCYVRTNDPKYPEFIGKFVGVKGKLINDPQLTLDVVDATAIAVVDPGAVNKRVTAHVLPPSMRQGAAQTATTEGN